MEEEIKLTRKQKRVKKLREKLLNPVDIKYQGPLSYRYLRILAWIFLALAQVIVMNNLGTKIFGENVLGNAGGTVISLFASLATPFFIIASFGLVLSGAKSYKNFLIMYAAAFLGMAAGLCILYGRYVEGLLNHLGADPEFQQLLYGIIGSRAQINVFADLFAFVLFHFFINYRPKKIFVGKKKVLIFRLLSLIPVLYILASFIIKILSTNGTISLSFYVYPFLTTKSILVFFLFASISLWIKNRERIFIKIGATHEDYKAFLKTKRNSLSFSIQLSIFIAIFFFIELIYFLVLVICYMGMMQFDIEATLNVLNSYGVGQCLALLLAVPFILLYSYTRNHKNKMIDLFLPVIGIALIAFVYIEGFYQIIINLIQQ